MGLFRFRTAKLISIQLSALIFLAIVSLFLPLHLQAQISCERLVSGNARTRELDTVFTTANSLIKAGISVQKRSAQIDPKTTHIYEFEPAVKQIAAQIQLMLREKKSEKLYAERGPILMNIVREIGDRIKSQQVTYEWAVALPFRVGYLSQMGKTTHITDRKSVAPEVETSYYYLLNTYRSHENFMLAYEKASQHKPPRRRKPELKEYGDILFKTFPDKIFIPVFMDLSIPEVNKLFAAKIYPIGMTKKRFYGALDGQDFNEWTFPIHDLFHILNQTSYPGSTITPKLTDFMEGKSLEIADRARGVTFELFHLFHHMLFHEDNRFLSLTYQTRPKMIEQYSLNLENLMGRVVTFNAEKDVYPEVLLNMDLRERGQVIREAHQKYIEALKSVTDTHSSFVDYELSIMSSLR